MIRHLKKISLSRHEVTRAKCVVNGTEMQGKIVFEEQDGTHIGEIAYDHRSRAVGILKTPYDLGQPLVLGRALLTWNPLSDISYTGHADKLQKEVISGI
jgi:hypothetical protein